MFSKLAIPAAMAMTAPTHPIELFFAYLCVLERTCAEDCVAMVFQMFHSTLLSSPFEEYPLTKRFSTPLITPLLIAASVSTSFPFRWIILPFGFSKFAICLQAASFALLGRVEKTETFLLSQPNYLRDIGDTRTTCQPASIKLGDNVYTVNPPALGSPEEIETIASPGMFEWTFGDITKPDDEIPGRTYAGFLYEGDSLDCNFADTSYKYGFCGLCRMQRNPFYVKLCTSFDLSITKLPNFAIKLQTKLKKRLIDVFSAYTNLTIEPNSLPLSAFPPTYAEIQPDLYRNRTITPRDIYSATIWVGDMAFVPSPNYRFHDNDSIAMETPEASIYVQDSKVSIGFFQMFLETEALGSSGFQLSILGIGDIRPLGQEHALTVFPPIAILFNNSYTTLGWLMEIAISDLNQRRIGATYICVKSIRKWRPFITLISVALGSSSGVFGAVWALLICLARQYDTHKIRHQRTEDKEDEPPKTGESFHDVDLLTIRHTSTEPLITGPDLDLASPTSEVSPGPIE
ncbi:hypothetical protein O181_033982 [Austropuccinia psidii MF-1]|uniref:Uncharacterized protein n=1 Tax=Austropuccinia psidii MF-1 TaxID=1389203 RepID=A0A9Q3D5Q3_9BASI|nr:hypothetical protein [Austropuccinia psidii MF-1]